ncbi:v-SNARE protein [Artomyces pyxidatus]|uniref:V-SNARE protein n=1 Tax=Artomyces pyxidatus TaxID=48021 RepID=A0ACB8SU95_9AGAM|nr:v-SNARE protein [Artomyces pyxidatus]
MATYESLHRQCRTLESLFDTKLTSYARLASTLSRPSDPSNEHVDVEAGGAAGARWRGMEAEVEVEELLEKLGETNAALDKVAADTENPPSQSMMRAIQRHRDVYVDYTREFRRTKTNVQSALDQANLLTGVRNDIDAYKSSAADSLLAERGRIDSSHRMVDETLEQAYETRSEFARQRSSLGNIQTRMVGVLNTVPGINNILSMISKRRRRDSFLIGGLIGVCIFIILMYLFR